MIKRLKTLSAILALCACAFIAVGSRAETNVGLGAESRYITEGRDNLEENEINYAFFSSSAGTIDFEFWYGRSDFENYEEINLTLGNTWEVNPRSEFSIHYTYLIFKPGSEDDQELSFNWLYKFRENIPLQATTIYSKESDGFYSVIEGGYNSTFSSVQWGPTFAVGFNNGYVSDEHNGSDHYTVGLQLTYALRAFSIVSHLTATRGINEKSGESLVDEQWIGMETKYSF